MPRSRYQSQSVVRISHIYLVPTSLGMNHWQFLAPQIGDHPRIRASGSGRANRAQQWKRISSEIVVHVNGQVPAREITCHGNFHVIKI